MENMEGNNLDLDNIEEANKDIKGTAAEPRGGHSFNLSIEDVKDLLMYSITMPQSSIMGLLNDLGYKIVVVNKSMFESWCVQGNPEEVCKQFLSQNGFRVDSYYTYQHFVSSDKQTHFYVQHNSWCYADDFGPDGCYNEYGAC